MSEAFAGTRAPPSAASVLLGFEDCAAQARRLAGALGVPFMLIDVHTFPDGERLVRVPTELPEHVIFYRALHQPDHKLVELTLAAETARSLGARQLSLVCPYLCYMRQDIAFRAGEAVSAHIIGKHLARLFDDVITVDPHLHRVAQLDEAIPAKRAVAVSASALIGKFLASQLQAPLLLGPDTESLQWVRAMGESAGFEFGVANKQRQSDHEVTITLPDAAYQNRTVVLVDDVLSTGNTVAAAARLLRRRGAQRVFVAVTHALFVANATQLLATAGVEQVWSTDSVSHPSNAIELAPLLAPVLSSAPQN